MSTSNTSYFHQPVGLVDPWGLSPMTASEFREYRADTRGRAGERIVAGVKSVASSALDWVKDNWVGIAMVAGGAAYKVMGWAGKALAPKFSKVADVLGVGLVGS